MSRTWMSVAGGAFALAACTHTAAVGPAPAAGTASPVVTIETGRLQGEVTDTYRRFRGIPYAAPPVGSLRWRAPEPARAWSGVRDATVPGAACVQAPGSTGAPAMSEDCLYLEVVAPRKAGPRNLRPVMVWMHGGGFTGGSGFDYDARRLATEGDVVVVTLNYRLGALGFFGHPGLEHSGAYGLLDQQAALRWVRRNAEAFGGDPDNVTLFGESAGAMSACAQLVAPGAKGLFHKAILQSGSCLQRWAASMIWPGAAAFDQFPPVSRVEETGAEAARTLGCDGAAAVDCLRALPAAEVNKAFTSARPAWGGATLPERPAEALNAGRFHRVPLIWGSTRDEWRSSAGIFASRTPFTADLYRKFLADAFGVRAAEVEARYPVSDFESPAYAWAAVSTDSAWACPTLDSVRLASRSTPVFFYQFDDRDAPNPAYPVAAGFQLGAAHATELPYLFDLAGARVNLRPDQEQLAALMRRYWTAFAHTGRPGGEDRPPWPPVSGPDETLALSLDPAGVAPVDVEARHHCAFWRTVAG